MDFVINRNGTTQRMNRIIVKKYGNTKNEGLVLSAVPTHEHVNRIIAKKPDGHDAGRLGRYSCLHFQMGQENAS